MLRLLWGQDSKHVTDIRRHTHTQGTSDSETFDNDLRAHAPPHCISSSFFFCVEWIHIKFTRILNMKRGNKILLQKNDTCNKILYAIRLHTLIPLIFIKKEFANFFLRHFLYRDMYLVGCVYCMCVTAEM